MVDRYTKIILTIIAACLIWDIAAKQSSQRAFAQSRPVHVIVDAWGAYEATLPISVSLER
jgi:hypothetical protein